jgi:hypothetical protein
LGINTTLKAKYQIANFLPFIYIGPRIDFLLSSTQSSNNYKDFNYGFDCGIGLTYNLIDNLFLISDFGFGFRVNEIANYVKPSGNILIDFGLGYKFK